jgi:hypothetical protein
MAAHVGTKPPDTRGESGDIDLPPITDDDRRGGGARWVELTRASDDIDAHLLIGRLDEAGIETRTMKDRSGPGAWLLGGSDPWAPVVILVRAFELDSAKLVLAELAYEGPPAIPQATTTQAEHRKRTMLWWATAILLGVTFTALIVAQTVRAIPNCRIPILCTDR